jgi:uncharacterized protein YndB with AHSA1/START domain
LIKVGHFDPANKHDKDIIMKIYSTLVILLLSACTSWSQTKSEKEKMLAFEIEIDAPLDSVWARWATGAGRKKFLAPSSKFELATLGYMEVLFAPSAPVGQQGAENNRVLAWQEKELLSFTWDAPPQFTDVRAQRTMVIMRFKKLSDTKTLVTSRQVGFGTGGNWDLVYDYFKSAWGGFVLPNLKYSLEVKPIVWGNFPKDLKPATTLPE